MSPNGSANACAAHAGLSAELHPPEEGAAFELAGSKHGGGASRFWIWLAAVVAVGTLGLAPVFMGLWEVWTNDPLRSIGMLIVPASIILTLREWKKGGWELRGTWWGVLPLVLALLSAESRVRFGWYVIAGQARLNLFSPGLSLYCFASGVILLFAGARLWRRAWFPLGLLLLAQPVPAFGNQYLDLPLQSLSAHVARKFAVWIGFPPTNPQLLRLMFSPAFGMFIAPGCDGLRGAVTLGYVALIAGYLKRVSLPRWILYVTGAVLLGYFFNLVRLCALILYYRAALGHPLLEQFAKQADYLIGGCLMLFAAVLFLWIVMRKTKTAADAGPSSSWHESHLRPDARILFRKVAAFAVLAAIAAVGGLLAIRDFQKSLVESVRDGELTPSQLDDLLPKQLGSFKLNRAWQQEANGRLALETGAYSSGSSGEVILGVWLPPGRHSVRDSWKVHGEDPQLQSSRHFVTAQGRSVLFDTSFYSDGVADSFAGDVICTPSACLPPLRNHGVHLLFTMHPIDFKTRGTRAVPIFFRVEAPRAAVPDSAAYEELSAEAERFLKDIDFPDISRRFQ